MIFFSFALVFLICCATKGFSLKVSFITWNVNDNKKFNNYNTELVSSLLQLESLESENLPDIYAITFQENCVDCKDAHLNRIANPFIETLQSLKSTKYNLVTIFATRRSALCETLFCLSSGSMHGTTLIMIIAKEALTISNVFEDNENGCTHEFYKNKEKGVAIAGLSVGSTKYCFGGLHLDVSNILSRQECLSGVLKKVKDKCDIIFLGGDFNSRPKSKDTRKPVSYEGGQDKELFEKMRKTDDLSGPNPYSGGVNLLTFIFQEFGIKFIEPFNKPPNFLPTYSIDSSVDCQFSPVCYKPNKYPSWTDRIIFTPSNRINCTEYKAIELLARLSDHLPVFTNCVIN